MLRRSLLLGIASCLSAAGITVAETVKVSVSGSVDYNVIGGAMGGSAGTPSGTPVTMSFDIDSDNFLKSSSFPTRGYPVDLNSFSMRVGSVNVPISNPQPDGSTPYFVIRDNDPAVDGFFLSPGVDWDFPVTVTIPGLVPDHELEFTRTFADAAPLTSLNILDAVGTYDASNLSGYYWSIGRFGNPGAEYGYESMTIEVLPEPGVASMFAIALFGLSSRSRKRSA